jgi:hypothetical protein
VVLSKRERYIGIGTMAALGLLIVNSIIIQPLVTVRADLEKQTADQYDQLSHDNQIIRDAGRKGPRWKEMTRSGLQLDASGAESQIFNATSGWSREAGFDPPPALRADHSEKEKDFFKIAIRGTGNGTMEQISQFLYRIQSATFPVRVSDITINTHGKEGTDDLSMNIGLVTAYIAPPSDNAAKTQTASAEEVRP